MVPWSRIAARTLGALAIVLLVAGFGQLAHAQDPVADPTELYQKALDAYDADDCGRALPMFREALAVTKSPNARLFVARCLEKEGDIVAAYEEMSVTLAEARARAASEEKYVGTRDAAAKELALLEPRISRILIALAEPYESVAVLVSGRELSRDALNKPVITKPGVVRVKARAPGRKTQILDIKVEPGGTATAAIVLPIDDGSVDTEPDPGPAIDLSIVQIAGIGVAAVGVAGVVAFAVSGSMASSTFDEVNAACGGARCTDPNFAGQIDDGKTQETIANVSIGIGIAALLGGAAMIVFGGDDDPAADAEAEAARIEIDVLPTLGGAVVRGSF